jgi:hypothetical protein
MKDVLNMSDEEFAKVDYNDIGKEDETSTSEPDNNTESSEELTSNNSETNIESKDTTNDEVSNQEDNSTVTNSSGSEEESSESTSDEKTEEVNSNEPVENNAEKSDVGDQATTPTDGDTDKLSWYEKLSKPFKANGREFTVKSPEESIRLMQLGLGYTKKMQSLSNDRRIAETLRQANISTPQDIGFLLDLKNGNKEAIKQLLKDHKIDPNDLVSYDDTDESEDGSSAKQTYTPTNPNFVDDKYLALQDQIQELMSVDGGNDTVNLILGLDSDSKKVFYQNPQLIATINNHRHDIMPSGVSMFDEIMQEADRQKALGNIPANAPWIQVYKQVGDYLYGDPLKAKAQQGAYIGSSKPQQNTTKPRNDEKVKQLSIPKNGAVNKVQHKDIFSMTDEEFAKLGENDI